MDERGGDGRVGRVVRRKREWKGAREEGEEGMKRWKGEMEMEGRRRKWNGEERNGGRKEMEGEKDV